MKTNPELKQELLPNAQKQWGKDELPFPQYFDLKITKDDFCNSTTTIEETDIPHPNVFIPTAEYAFWRLQKILQNKLPRSLKPLLSKNNKLHTQIYVDKNTQIMNIQFGKYNEEKDIEYNFNLAADKKVSAILIRMADWLTEWTFKRKEQHIRGRITYCPRYTNCAGSYYDIYGYLYTPKKRKQ